MKTFIENLRQKISKHALAISAAILAGLLLVGWLLGAHSPFNQGDPTLEESAPVVTPLDDVPVILDTGQEARMSEKMFHAVPNPVIGATGTVVGYTTVESSSSG